MCDILHQEGWLYSLPLSKISLYSKNIQLFRDSRNSWSQNDRDSLCVFWKDLSSSNRFKCVQTFGFLTFHLTTLNNCGLNTSYLMKETVTFSCIIPMLSSLILTGIQYNLVQFIYIGQIITPIISRDFSETIWSDQTLRLVKSFRSKEKTTDCIESLTLHWFALPRWLHLTFACIVSLTLQQSLT